MRRLMFNPYSEKIYDYLGGIEDIKKAKVCGACLFHFCISLIVLFSRDASCKCNGSLGRPKKMIK
jgi:hypothetical protein